MTGATMLLHILQEERTYEIIFILAGRSVHNSFP
jgi:hypothetical protein